MQYTTAIVFKTRTFIVFSYDVEGKIMVHDFSHNTHMNLACCFVYKPMSQNYYAAIFDSYK